MHVTLWRAQVLDRVRLASLLQVQAIMALCIAFMEVRAPSLVRRCGAWGLCIDAVPGRFLGSVEDSQTRVD